MERFAYGFAYGGGIAQIIGVITCIYLKQYTAAGLNFVGLVFAFATVAQGKPSRFSYSESVD